MTRPARPARPARLTWLVGPPGAGKSTFTRRQREFDRSVELNAMLGPLIDPLGVRKGVLAANAKLVEAIRAIELHADNATLDPLLVVAGLVPEHTLFPLDPREQVWLLLPERERWELQLRSRPSGTGSERQYDDIAYSRLWYDRFCEWLARGVPLRRIDGDFEPGLLGRICRNTPE
jgi:hypothetical protein